MRWSPGSFSRLKFAVHIIHMDFFAGLFGLVLLVFSVVLAYHLGIKPDREEKRRRAERALAEMRRQRWERSRKRPAI